MGWRPELSVFRRKTASHQDAVGVDPAIGQEGHPLVLEQSSLGDQPGAGNRAPEAAEGPVAPDDAVAGNLGREGVAAERLAHGAAGFAADPPGQPGIGRYLPGRNGPGRVVDFLLEWGNLHPHRHESESTPLTAKHPVLVPDWFIDAVVRRPVEADVDCDGCRVHYLAWGERGAPGLILVHGGGAHAHWWDPLAPQWCDGHRVVALDLRGMGDSDHQEAYCIEELASDLFAVAADAGAAGPLTIVGHSFGGFVAMRAAVSHPGDVHGIVVIDSPVRRADDPYRFDSDRNPFRVRNSYSTFEEAVRRFRLVPEQPCDNTYYVDYIARYSLQEAEEGWTWKFHANYFARLKFERFAEQVAGVDCGKAYLYGEDSRLIEPRMLDFVRSIFGPDAPVISIENAHHHVLLDQPLRLVEEIHGILAGWDAMLA